MRIFVVIITSPIWASLKVIFRTLSTQPFIWIGSGPGDQEGTYERLTSPRLNPFSFVNNKLSALKDVLREHKSIRNYVIIFSTNKGLLYGASARNTPEGYRRLKKLFNDNEGGNRALRRNIIWKDELECHVRVSPNYVQFFCKENGLQEEILFRLRYLAHRER